jgi:tRNA pseudouridine55 synthase
MDGWLNLYKPANMSSAYLVAKVKKILGKDIKVGHCGTLDPLAEGVLPIVIGQATKLSNYIICSCKTYVFTVQFGSQTSTGDAEGAVINSCDFIPNSIADLEQVCDAFLGQIQQKTPAYSAVKSGGIAHYKLARKGLDVPEKIRQIEIFSLKLLDADLKNGQATYQASCSKGTYIRSLAEDIAFSLKSLGFVIRLRRVAVKNFCQANSLDGDILIQLPLEQSLDRIKSSLLAVEFILDDIPVFDLSQEDALRITQGKTIELPHDDLDLVWLRYNKRLLTIGNLLDNKYNIFRNFNL